MFVSRMSRERKAGTATQSSTPALMTCTQRILRPASSTAGVQNPITASAWLASSSACAALSAVSSFTPGATACSAGNASGMALATSTALGLAQPLRSRTGVADSSSPSLATSACVPALASTTGVSARAIHGTPAAATATTASTPTRGSPAAMRVASDMSVSVRVAMAATVYESRDRHHPGPPGYDRGMRTAPTIRSLPLDPEHAAFIQGGVSVVVSTRDDALVADVARGCGCRVSRDRRRVTVLVEYARSGCVLENVQANGHVAVVYSQPSTHRTLQLKGTDARVARAAPSDLRVSQRHLEAWIADMQRLGYGASFGRAVRGAGTDLAAITFSVAAAFEQTPGPAAGRRLGG
jgi:hypothetical protein